MVDNASSDGSDAIAERLADEHERVRLQRSATNRGYAGAVNLALPEARGEFVAVLNMDVVVSSGWLDPLVGFLEETPDAGVACPLILLESDPQRINAAGQNLNKTGLGFNRWLDKPRGVAGEAPFEVDGLHGAAFVIRRELLERLGGWDESGFLYFEDVELSWLLRIAGAEIWCVPDLHGLARLPPVDVPPQALPARAQSLEDAAGRPARPGTRLALSPLLVLTELMMWGYCLLRGPKFLRAKRQSYGWVRASRAQIGQRREQVDSVRRRSDREVLRGLDWGYPLDQFWTLGRERGQSQRDRFATSSGRPT